MGKKSGSIVFEIREQLDSLVALGMSRHNSKAEAQAIHLAKPLQSRWNTSTECIHSIGTLETYKAHAVAFVQYARDQHGVRHLNQFGTRLDEILNGWLAHERDRGVSPWTLQTARSALRMAFQDRTLGSSVAIPVRRRESISRSRNPAKRDRHFSEANWRTWVDFQRATGLRRCEYLIKGGGLRVHQVHVTMDGIRLVSVVGKGGKPREIMVVPGQEHAVLAAIRGKAPDDLVFEQIPTKADIHGMRRQYAQSLYRALSGRGLPPATGRLTSKDYDLQSVLRVSQSLGHNRRDVVLLNYLR